MWRTGTDVSPGAVQLQSSGIRGENMVEDQAYTIVFVDVHNKVKAFKSRLRETNKGDAEHRESRFVQETKEMEVIDKKRSSSR